jgi:hypothetical protein
MVKGVFGLAQGRPWADLGMRMVILVIMKMYWERSLKGSDWV